MTEMQADLATASYFLAQADRRINDALELHAPDRICAAHHQHHDCPEPHGYLFRCFVCRGTRATPCRTWQALTGKDKPDE